MVNHLFAILVVTLLGVSSLQATEQAQEVSQTSPTLNDPTQPLGYIKKTTKKKTYRQRLPILQSVVLDNQKRRAIMNNKFYEVGQMVNGYKISRIDNDAVLLVYGAKTYRVSLYSNAEKFSQ